MLSFQVINRGEASEYIQVLCDELGLRTLEDALAKVRVNGGHLHLRTPANGGNELSEKTPWGEHAVGEVVITTGGD